MFKRASIWFILLSSFLISNTALSETYYVKKEGSDSNDGTSWGQAFLTITKAMDEVTTGDSVWVAEGEYKEGSQITIPEYTSLYGGFSGTESDLPERDVESNETVINGEEDHRCAYNHGLLDGLTLINGYRGGVSEIQKGGGIYNDGGIVQNCLVSQCKAVTIYMYLGAYEAKGGGVYNDEGEVNNSVIYDNTVEAPYSFQPQGGGIYNYKGTVANCDIYENTGESVGGVYNNKGALTNSLIYSNNSKGVENINGTITNCTIYSNNGTGVILQDKGVVTNCICWNNFPVDIQGDLSFVTYTCFDKAKEENNNIRVNPLFVNTSGDVSTWDFHLQNGSACIDAGNKDKAPDEDIEGNPRPGEDGKVCMGAYESSPEYEPSEYNPVRLYVSKAGDNSNGASWEEAYTSITVAISNATGDTGDDLYDIWVAEGIYQEGEEILVPGKISLLGGFEGNESVLSERNIEKHKTRIDGNNNYRCMKNFGHLNGIWVTRGYVEGKGAGILNQGGIVISCIAYNNRADNAYRTDGLGGSIYNSGGTVEKCRIFNNIANHGGGIYNSGGSVSQCMLYQNEALEAYSVYGKGAGIYNESGSEITSCTVYLNESDDEGGGVYNEHGGFIYGCNIYDNSTGFFGGGVYNYGGLVSGSLVHDNIATKRGGGIFNCNSNDETGVVRNCTIYHNNAESGGGIQNNSSTIIGCTFYQNNADEGGGVYSSGKLINCEIYMNSAKNGGGVYHVRDNILNCTIYKNSAEIKGGGVSTNNDGNIINCIIWNNAPQDIAGSFSSVSYSCFEQAFYSENNNIRANPLFINTSGTLSTWNFHLQNGSPCIDSGNIDIDLQKDMEGNPRPGTDGKICMGAYESPDLYQPDPPREPVRIYVSKDGNNTDGSSWETAFNNITTAIDTTGDDLAEIWIAEGEYKEGKQINIYGRISLYGGFAGSENQIEERDPDNYETIIDGNNSHRCVLSCGWLDGFTVRNGRVDEKNGGGIYNYKGTVTKCIVRENYSGGGEEFYSAGGGGIYNVEGSVNNSVICDNVTERWKKMGGGGGIYNTGMVTKCLIYDNLSRIGGGIHNNEGVVTNCTVYGNSAIDRDGRGGGIDNYRGTVVNCTVYKNRSNESGGISNSNEGIIANCISWNNKNGDIEGNTDMVSYSCFFESEASNNNLKGNPLFVNTSGDMSEWNFQLQNGSPCIDKGNLAVAPVSDIRGKPRPGADGKVCIGAYESPSDYKPDSPRPRVTIYVSKNGNNTDGKSWEDAYSSITTALKVVKEDLSGDDLYEIWVAEGLYQENKDITVSVKTPLYGGFAGIESDLSERNWQKHLTIIDGGGNQYSQVKNEGILDGVIIRNYTYMSVAVYNYGVIKNCKICMNENSGLSNRKGLVKNCAIYSNGERGIYNDDGDIINCIVYRNNEGGIYNRGSVVNCTVYRNNLNGDAYGIANYGVIRNSIAWNNGSRDIIENHSNVHYSCFNQGRVFDQNIRANPLFVNTAGDSSTWDLRLQNGSPCIDAANPDDAPEKDIEGNFRPGADNKVCMGAYESPHQYEPAAPPEPIRFYVSKKGNNTDGSSWEDAFTSITTTINECEGVTEDDLLEIWVDDDLYQEGEILVPGKVSILGGFSGNETHISQRNISEKRVIIAGENSHRPVVNYGLLDGIYVKNGNTDKEGGGIYNLGGQVINSAIYNNLTEDNGGGIYNQDGAVINCAIYDNNTDGNGGGIYNSNGNVTSCTIYLNIGTSYWSYGGGIYNDGGSAVKCRVYNNSAKYNGGGIYNKTGNIVKTTVYDNFAGKVGGGIYNECEVRNCIIFQNRGYGIFNSKYGIINSCTLMDHGTGIYNEPGGMVKNVISWNNEYNDIDENLSGVSYSCFAEAQGDNQNISDDPLFVNVSGDVSTWDFHLLNSSPCIDAGTSEGAPEDDIEGTPRPQGSGFDMGAYEFPFPDSAKYLSQETPEELNPGEEFNVSISMKNIGATIWSRDDGCRLGDIATTTSLWGISRVDLAPGETVGPDDKTSFTFKIKAPATEGEYDFQWQMIKEPEDKWFGEKTPLLKISVMEAIPGDINDNGVLDMDDVNQLRNHILRITTLDPEAASRADANEDNVLNVCDLITIMLNM